MANETYGLQAGKEYVEEKDVPLTEFYRDWALYVLSLYKIASGGLTYPFDLVDVVDWIKTVIARDEYASISNDYLRSDDAVNVEIVSAMISV